MSSTRVDAPHSGLNHVRKWLAKLPAGTKQVRLVLQGEEERESVLAEWAAADAVPRIAPEVIELLDAQACATEAHVVGVLRFVRGERAAPIERIVRRRYERPDDDAPHSLSGSALDQAAQAQRFAEKAMARADNAVSMAMHQLTRASEMAMTLAERLADRLAMVDQQHQQALAQLDRQSVVEVVEDEPKPDEPEDANLQKLITMAMPLLLQAQQAPKKEPS